MSFLRAAFLTGLLLFAISLQGVHAESVSVNREDGQGFLISQRNNCYLILPRHILGRSLNLTIAAGAPSVTGEARVFHVFDDLDLAVAHVAGDFHGRCIAPFDGLPRRSDGLLTGLDRLTLVRVETSGLITREPVELAAILYDSLTLRRPQGTREFGQGTSGAFVFAGTNPVGMMITATDQNNAEAIRIDAIVARIARLLESGPQGGDLPPPSDPPATAPQGSIPFHVAACTPEPLDPDHACSRLESGGTMLMPPGQRVVLVLDLPGDTAHSIRGVTLSSVADQAYAPPRALRVEIDTSTGSQRRWRSFAQGDMSPFGLFQIDRDIGQLARRLRITIDDSWNADLPLRLDHIEIR